MRVPSSWRPLGLVTLVLLGGCVDDAPATDGPVGPSPTDATQTSPFAKPLTHAAGSWWKYATTSSTSSDPMTLVVTRLEQDAYITDTNSRAMAALDSEIDISYIGPLLKSDLSGRQRGDLIQYFRFPLEADQEWSTRWDGNQRTIRAIGAQGDEFQLEAREGSTLRAKYSYHAKAGLFGSLAFFTAAGDPLFSLRLLDHGQNYTGTLVRADTKSAMTPQVMQDQPSSAQNAQLTITAGTHELLLRYALKCTQPSGAWSLVLKPQDANKAQTDGYKAEGACPATVPQVNVTLKDPWVGTWTYAGHAAFGPGPNSLGVYAFTRTYQEFAYP